MKSSGWFAPEAKNTTTTDWGSLAWMVNSRLVEGAEMTMVLVTINVGHSNPSHVHPNCEEIVYIVSGRCDQFLAGERFSLEIGQGLVIPRGVEHYSTNTGEAPLEVLVCYSSPDRETIFAESGAEY